MEGELSEQEVGGGRDRKARASQVSHTSRIQAPLAGSPASPARTHPPTSEPAWPILCCILEGTSDFQHHGGGMADERGECAVHGVSLRARMCSERIPTAGCMDAQLRRPLGGRDEFQRGCRTSGSCSGSGRSDCIGGPCQHGRAVTAASIRATSQHRPDTRTGQPGRI